MGVKLPEREADHSPPSSAEVKEWVALYLHFPIRLHDVVLSYSTGTTLPFINRKCLTSLSANRFRHGIIITVDSYELLVEVHADNT
jgi:hypothetical protein